jgi:hypothetical protein
MLRLDYVKNQVATSLNFIAHSIGFSFSSNHTCYCDNTQCLAECVHFPVPLNSKHSDLQYEAKWLDNSNMPYVHQYIKKIDPSDNKHQQTLQNLQKYLEKIFPNIFGKPNYTITNGLINLNDPNISQFKYEYKINLIGNILGKKYKYTGFFNASYNEYLLNNAPNVFETLNYSISNGLISGLTLGLTKAIGRPSLYCLSMFTFKCASYSKQMFEMGNDNPSDILFAVSRAAIETGQIILLQVILDKLSDIINAYGKYLEKNNQMNLGNIISKSSSLLRYGIFAIQPSKFNFLNTAACIFSGGIAESAVSKATSYLRTPKK